MKRIFLALGLAVLLGACRTPDVRPQPPAPPIPPWPVPVPTPEPGPQPRPAPTDVAPLAAALDIQARIDAGETLRRGDVDARLGRARKEFRQPRPPNHHVVVTYPIRDPQGGALNAHVHFASTGSAVEVHVR